MKTKGTFTLKQVAAKQARKANALRNLQDDPDEADRIESMSPEAFAEEEGLQIKTSPSKRGTKEVANTGTSVKNDYEDALFNVWQLAQDCGGSRAELQECLDAIQDAVEEVIPDIEDQIAEDEESSDDE